MRHTWMVAALALVGAAVAGCSKGEGCLGDAAGCRVETPCKSLSWTCEGGSLELKVLAREDEARPGLDALSSAGDVQIGNDQVVAVIAAIGNQNFLDPNGGGLLDLYNRGKDNDSINQVLTVTGILPGDSVRYTKLEILDERPARVAVQVSGTLDGRPDHKVYTRYEVRPCEPGIRIRTEIVNGAPDNAMWALSDGFYWSKREPLPFTPGEGVGFNHPSFNLLTINGAYRTAPFLASTPVTDPAASYALVACNQQVIEGFQSDVVSTGGLVRTVVPPRGYQVYERFLGVAAGRDAAAGASLAQEVRGKLFGEKTVVLSGKVEAPASLAGSGFRTSVLVLEGTAETPAEKRVPWSQAVPGEDGAFRVRVPAGKPWVVEVHHFGKKSVERVFDAVNADADLGTFTLPATAKVRLEVSDTLSGAWLDSEVFLVAADDATRTGAAGTFHGQMGSCSPWLGPPPGASPACNRVLVRSGVAEFEAPLGKFHLYAFKGPFWTLARRTETFTPAGGTYAFRLRELAVQPQGTITADLHVHGAASFDSSLPDRDRVLSFAATDLDVAVATDHDVVYDYSTVVAELGLQQKLSTVTGVETTAHIPWFKIPGSDFPLVIGHYNFWPLAYQPWLPRNGGPYDEQLEPGELFDRADTLYTSSVPVVQLNHPWAEAEFGRDLGFPRALGLNALQDLPAKDDGTVGGMYVRARGKNANNAHHAQEVMNGTENDLLPAYRAFWFYTLSQGQLSTGTANSDSHGLVDNTVGVPRNVVFADTAPGTGFEVDRLNEGIRAGRVLGTNGPVITAELSDKDGTFRPYGFTPVQPGSGSALRLKVSAAPWVPVEEIRVVVNGAVTKTFSGADLQRPGDAFGWEGLVRFDREIPLSELALPAGRDAWVVVEAGAPLPVVGDVGGGFSSETVPHGTKDGIPDTADNDGDGAVTEKDVATGAKVGPMRPPPPPQDEAHPQFHFSQVVTGGYPFAFTNPFILDADGNGRFDAPGAESK
ncbi:MAG: hypothetical protein RL653_1702 [Pseudomonadota bacterium]